MRYYILCPWAETGGPEALHQLCSTLNEIGQEAYIYYYDNDYSQIHKNEFVPKYSEYLLRNSNISNFNSLDQKHNVVIIPEVIPVRIVENFQYCKVVFWRLSTNTYGQELNLPVFQKIFQGCQSETQFNILKNSNIFTETKYFRLTDYINQVYLIPEEEIHKNRKNQVLYNPKKGINHTQKIINTLVGNEFILIPINGLSNFEIRKLILESKIYIDFGHHPGKDRIPRECASGGCVVITGTQGCGSNEKDIPILTKFNYNENLDSYEYTKIGKCILDVLDNYEIYFKQQEQYRNQIRKEKQIFTEEVQQMVGILNDNM